MAYDKKLHLIAGFLIATTINLISNPLWGLGASILAGALKEGYDYLHQDKHSVELADFLYTVAGGILSVLISSVFYYLYQLI